MTEKDKQKARLYQIMSDNDLRYHYYPHFGAVNDWFLAYIELSRALKIYFDDFDEDWYEVTEDLKYMNTPPSKVE